MALWQYIFQILPKESYCILKDDVKISFSNDLFDDEPFWKYKPISINLFGSIENILHTAKSWSDEMVLYGNLESNCIKVFFNSKTNYVESVSFRIDFTSDFGIVLQEVIEFCVLEDLIMLDETFQLLPLNYEKIKGTIEDSQQVKKYNELIIEKK